VVPAGFDLLDDAGADQSRRPPLHAAPRDLHARVSSEQQAEAGTILSQIDVVKEKIEASGLFLDQKLCFVDGGI
jgi:hypothetical protein